YVSDEQRKFAAGPQRLGDEGSEVAFHIPAIMKAGQRIRNRQLDTLGEPVAKKIGMALALDLGSDARQELVAVDRAHQVIINTHVEAAKQTRLVSRLDKYDDGQVPRPLKRADLRAEPQPIGALKRQADHEQIEIAFCQSDERCLTIAFSIGLIALGKNFQKTGRRTRMVIDQKDAPRTG